MFWKFSFQPRRPNSFKPGQENLNLRSLIVVDRDADRECSKCLYDEKHPFGLEFSASGVCSGCTTHEEKNSQSFDAGIKELQNFILERRPRPSSGFDCLIPIQPSPEYFYLVHLVKNEIGLNPLLCFYNNQFSTRVGIQNLARIKEVFDLDLEVFITSPTTYRRAVRHSIRTLGSVSWPAKAGEIAFALRLAKQRGIPAIIWPYNDATEQVGAFSYADKSQLAFHSWVHFELNGKSPDAFFSSSSGLPEDAKWQFQMPYKPDGPAVGIYASNYIPWDSRRFAEEAVLNHSALSAKNPGTFDTYDKSHDHVALTFQDLLKHVKFGYGKVRDHLVQEVRFGRLDRETAIEIERSQQPEALYESIEPFASWLGISSQNLRWVLEYWNKKRIEPFGLESQTRGNTPQPPLSQNATRFLGGYLLSESLPQNPGPILFGKGIGWRESFSQKTKTQGESNRS